MVLDVRARQGVDRVVAPIGRALSKVGITPSMVTVAGLAITIVGAVFIGRGQLLAGAIIAAAGSLLDVIDGPLARTTGTASRRGALLDTLADRLGETAIWIGLVHFVAGEARLVTLAVVGLAASMLVPYIRSKAEGWGAAGRGGLMGRAERLIVMLAGIGLQGFEIDTFRPLEASLWILAIATWLTVAQRSWRTWRQLGE
jgi:CDP-diacylglycerol--glycerol-3-phosphate 3-phosphatidyltransferase